MREETFGPVVGIMKVADDDEAVALMNDSRLRPDRSDLDARPSRPRARLGGAMRDRHLYINRCDYLDPALAWTGVKDSGRGVYAVAARASSPSPGRCRSY